VSERPRPLRHWMCSARQFSSLIAAPSRSKARYLYYLDLKDPYPDIRLTDINVTSAGPVPSRYDAERQAADWNEAHPVGTPVVLTNDYGTLIRTRTRSEAWTLGSSPHAPGHTAVVKVDGIAGGYHLDRIRPEAP
jgi:hypothetical protein